MQMIQLFFWNSWRLTKITKLFGRILQMLEIKYKYRKKQKLSFFQRLDTEVILTLNWTGKIYQSLIHLSI